MVFSFSLGGILINYRILAPTMSKMLNNQKWLTGFISCVISHHLAMAINVLRRLLRLNLGTEPSSISCLLLGLMVCTHLHFLFETLGGNQRWIRSSMEIYFLQDSHYLQKLSWSSQFLSLFQSYCHSLAGETEDITIFMKLITAAASYSSCTHLSSSVDNKI